MPLIVHKNGSDGKCIFFYIKKITHTYTNSYLAIYYAPSLALLQDVKNLKHAQLYLLSMGHIRMPPQRVEIKIQISGVYQVHSLLNTSDVIYLKLTQPCKSNILQLNKHNK